jgi:predicted ABC-type ATPase
VPILHLVAGPNGAGKSTLYSYLIAPRYPTLEFVNADVHEREYLSHIADPLRRSEAARSWADARRDALLRQGDSFVTETVFSHPSKLALVEDAQTRGYSVVLYVVCLDEPRVLLRRVKRRVGEGGHHVPANKILERYPRTLANLALAIRIADMAMLFDAGEVSAGGPHLLATCSRGAVELHAAPLPRWAARMLGPDA